MESKQAALDFLNFVDSSPSPYHAVKSTAEMFQKAGFDRLEETADWAANLCPGGKYYIIRNYSSIIAFAIGVKWAPGNPIAMVCAHTDSPCLRIKPDSRRSEAGFLQIGVEKYGGATWHTWFDRDLSVAGLVLLKNSDCTISRRLVQIDWPILRIPTLAIHLHRSPVFQPNLEIELVPIAGLVANPVVEPHHSSSRAGNGQETDPDADFEPLKSLPLRHHQTLIEIIAKELGVDWQQIIDFDLVVYDTQKSSLGGMDQEFLFAPRLDNLTSVYCSTSSLIQSVSTSGWEDESGIRLVAAFDHEECGSESAQGAASTLLPHTIQRLSTLGNHWSSNLGQGHTHLDGSLCAQRTLSSSFLVSADMAHSVHPNYVEKHERNHRPRINNGMVIKINSKQLYTTTSHGVLVLREMAKLARVPLQLFVDRNDTPCGSTIGPMLSAALGVRTVDVGNPQLSMHSIRETGGARNVEFSIQLFRSFLSNYCKMVGVFALA